LSGKTIQTLGIALAAAVLGSAAWGYNMCQATECKQVFLVIKQVLLLLKLNGCGLLC
jgi:hypothetical protein